MTCEKQFLPANSTILYCSERCVVLPSSSPPREVVQERGNPQDSADDDNANETSHT